MSVLLSVLYPAEFAASYPLEGSITLGRSPDCTISLADEWISRNHCRIWIEDQTVWLEDLGSTNGTFVDGQMIDRINLLPQHRIQIGKVILQISTQVQGADRTLTLPVVSQISHFKPKYGIGIEIQGWEGLLTHFGADGAAFAEAECAFLLDAERLSEEQLHRLGSGRFSLLSLCENDQEAEEFCVRLQTMMNRHRFAHLEDTLPIQVQCFWEVCLDDESPSELSQRLWA
jgi:hypothetical protein